MRHSPAAALDGWAGLPAVTTERKHGQPMRAMFVLWTATVGAIAGCGVASSGSVHDGSAVADESAEASSSGGGGEDSGAVDIQQAIDAPATHADRGTDLAPVVSVDVAQTPDLAAPALDATGSEVAKPPDVQMACVGSPCDIAHGVGDPACERQAQANLLFCVDGKYVDKCPGCVCHGTVCWTYPYPDGFDCTANTDCRSSFCHPQMVCGELPTEAKCAGRACGALDGGPDECASVLPCVEGIRSYTCETSPCPPRFPRCLTLQSATPIRYCR